jgi:hypothetical protein
MVDEKKKKTATPSESGRRSTLDSNPQKSDVWWCDADYHDKVPPVIYDDSAPRSKEFAEYRSFLIEKGLSEYDGQTLRYMVALEDEYREKIKDYNEQLGTAIYNQLQAQYTVLCDERTALAKQLADEKDEQKLLEEITILCDEKAALEEQVEQFTEQVLSLRKELSTAQAAVVQAVTGQGNGDTGAPSPATSRPPPPDNLCRHSQRQNNRRVSARHQAVLQD